MSKKPKRSATKTHANRDGTVLNVETALLIAGKSVIAGLVEAKTSTRKKVATANDAFGKKFSAAVDKDHVDRRAANIAYGLASLEDEQLHITLYHLFFYIRDLGLLDRAKKQEELFSAAETGPGLADGKGAEGGEAAEGDGGDGPTRIGAAARRVMEQAGGSPSAE